MVHRAPKSGKGWTLPLAAPSIKGSFGPIADRKTRGRSSEYTGCSSRCSSGSLGTLIRQQLRQLADQRLPLLHRKRLEIPHPPSHGGQLPRVGRGDQRPVGLAALEAEKEGAVGGGHCADQLRDHLAAGVEEVLEGHRFEGHAGEAALEGLGDVFGAGGEDLAHGAVMAEEVDDESLAQSVGQALAAQEVAYVEEVPRVLAVKGREQLAGIEILEGDHLRLGEAEGVLDRLADGHVAGLADHAAQDRGNLYLHPRAGRGDGEAADGALGLRAGDACARNVRKDARLDAPHAGVDAGQRLRAVVQRQIGQVDVDREARQVAVEEVDRRAALQREVALLRDQRQDPDQKAHLPTVSLINGHPDPPAR